ncbi:MAG: aminopeptidase [Lachnospiraceae bacterium]|nr:aminopeptidase [Lachnospiraceae bacterium]
MDYHERFSEENEQVRERYFLATDRISAIIHEDTVPEPYRDYFVCVAQFLLELEGIRYGVESGEIYELPHEKLDELNCQLYRDMLYKNYESSYLNPAFAVSKLGLTYGRLLSFLYSELYSGIAFLYEDRLMPVTFLLELFIEIYNIFENDDELHEELVKSAIYTFESDYIDFFVGERTRELLDPSLSFATDIIMSSDLRDVKTLYRYGEYISENEKDLFLYLSKLSEEKIEAMAATFTKGFYDGFVAAGIDLSKKKTVNIRYHIGQERIVKAAILQFERMGLKPVIFRSAKNRVNMRGVIKIGYESTSPNKQYEYDHRQDEALFFDKTFAEIKIEAVKKSYEENKELAGVYAGPAVIEVFGEEGFEPINNPDSILLTEEQQKLSVSTQTTVSKIVNDYIPRDKYSFTIIAFPIPAIGENFEEIFDETVRINTLDSDAYKRMHQIIIDALDTAKYVRVLGKDGNETNMKVMLHKLSDPSKETNFENCVADVNIPVGEVFTSPILTGTEGILHVSGVYLNELFYKDLKITFKDGKVIDYTCGNFEEEDKNKAYIKDNVLFQHDTLPIGEFAIGTNTTAYVVGKRYGISGKLPILIAEKTGPHFALGDTCYSMSEDVVLRNPDGKEIIAKDNECSILRKEDFSKAYFNCHTDITIPFEELDSITAVAENGDRIDIIKDGLFVLPGLDELNKPLL